VRRGSYNGGSTKISLSDKGTGWETKWDQLVAVGEYFSRWDKRDDFAHEPSVQEHKRRRKEFTYFFRACAVAFANETLTRDFPPAPPFLRNRIRKAGGNTEWLASDKEALNLLTRMLKKNPWPERKGEQIS
jgi:hypothetical protein